ncbi:hypothetical protein [Thalassobaculum salexigens]|uniref:hypothetical protein n=1 Tax=Thalassobaculum salexigens TaxID=455360 RepID=UPI003CD0DFC7
MQMPEPDQEVLARRSEIVDALRAIVPGEGVIADTREMRPYESDGLTAYRTATGAVHWHKRVPTHTGKPWWRR